MSQRLGIESGSHGAGRSRSNGSLGPIGFRTAARSSDVGNDQRFVAIVLYRKGGRSRMFPKHDAEIVYLLVECSLGLRIAHEASGCPKEYGCQYLFHFSIFCSVQGAKIHIYFHSSQFISPPRFHHFHGRQTPVHRPTEPWRCLAYIVPAK